MIVYCFYVLVKVLVRNNLFGKERTKSNFFERTTLADYCSSKASSSSGAAWELESRAESRERGFTPVLPDYYLPEVVNIFLLKRQISVKATQISNLVFNKITEL